MFSFTLGAEAADGLKMPILLLGGIGGLFVLYWLGVRSWILIFVAPVVLPYLPLGSIQKIAPGYLISVGVLGYYLVLSLLGRVQLRWRSLFLLDFLVFIVFVAFAVQFVKYPVGINGLGAINGQIGAFDYLICLFATLFYITLTCIPLALTQLTKILRWMVFASLVMSFISVGFKFIGLGVGETIDKAADSRLSYFMDFGRTLFLVIVCFNTPWRIILSVWKALLLAIATFLVLLSGFREQLMQLGIYFIFACIIYRQKLLLLIIGLCTYGCIFVLSETQVLLDAPKGIQRAVSPLPGIEINERILSDANYSVDWRVEMWDQAMDPRSGYITDYVWGDGYGLDLKLLSLNQISISRGTLTSGNNEIFMDYGVWHSGYIHLIHRMGYVGLSLLAFTMFIFSVFALRVCFMYRGHPALPVVLFTLVVIPGNVIRFFISAGETPWFFDMYYNIAVAKVLYFAYKEEVLGEGNQAETQEGKYIPLMMREGPRTSLDLTRSQ